MNNEIAQPKCPKCTDEGVYNEVLGKPFWYCRTCKDEFTPAPQPAPKRDPNFYFYGPVDISPGYIRPQPLPAGTFDPTFIKTGYVELSPNYFVPLPANSILFYPELHNDWLADKDWT